MSTSTSQTNPEIGRSVLAAGIETNFHDLGTGQPTLLIHGSGPGVSAWVNWRGVLPGLSKRRRVIAPDIVGFGYTDHPDGFDLSPQAWVTHLVGLLDALELSKVSIVGNSFGGGLGLWLANQHPERVERLVLMGSVGSHFEITPGLDAVWGYQPSVENMAELLTIFAYNHADLDDNLAELRYRASIRPGVHESYSAMFPEPRQNGVDSLALPDDDLRGINHETLIVHGREDKVIPVSNSIRLNELIPNSQLHIFNKCGHWTQIEKSAEFVSLVDDFLPGAETS